MTVAFSVGGSGKTVINSDGIGSSWEAEDKVYLWAADNQGAFTLNGQQFTMHGFYWSEAVFLTNLSEAMPEGIYTYYACYPKPLSTNGTTVTFRVPDKQDGKLSSGTDIMIAQSAVGPALKPYKAGEQSSMNLRMKHQVHVLKFYVPEGSSGLKGETIKKIKFELSKNVAGVMALDLTDPSKAATLSEGTSTITVNCEEGITPSYGGSRNYACAAICPADFEEGGTLKITMYSDKWIGTSKDINLTGRNFLAGHCTPVKLEAQTIDPYYTLSFTISGNNLGENVQKVTFTAEDSSCKFGDEGGSTYVWQPGGDITMGSVVTFSYQDINNYLAMSGKKVTITYDSQHVICSSVVTMPDFSTLRNYNYALTVPYLLYEDFSSVPSFSSNDEYKTSSTGDMSAYTFLNGWTGGRVGASAGKCIRIAGRRESGAWIDAHYPARVDSAPLAQIKSTVDIELTFDYGTNKESYNTSVKGQNIYVGYTTSTKAYSSSDETGTFEGGNNNIATDLLDGSWTSTPHKVTMILHDIPAGSQNRICWRNNPYGKNEFAANTTTWCYIDNVKVKVKSN